MAEKPEALQLADELGGVSDALADRAADELRRLVAENEALKLTLALQKASYERVEVAAEREACAAICDEHASIEGIAQRCAEQIRARSKT